MFLLRPKNTLIVKAGVLKTCLVLYKLISKKLIVYSHISLLHLVNAFGLHTSGYDLVVLFFISLAPVRSFLLVSWEEVDQSVDTEWPLFLHDNVCGRKPQPVVLYPPCSVTSQLPGLLKLGSLTKQYLYAQAKQLLLCPQYHNW